MQADKIAFDKELGRGISTYNEIVGRWWLSQAANSSHRYAYRNIADFIQSSFPGAPEVIVDYACGQGDLLSRLHQRFPNSSLVGLDCSPLLLDCARRRLARLGRQAGQRVRLIETLLPDFELPRAIADLVLFVFPNIVSCSEDDDIDRRAHLLGPADLALGRKLAWHHDPESGEIDDDPQTIYETLLRDRLVSRNIRGLLKRDGICVRVEYGNVRREELPHLELLRTAYEEGSLEHEIDGIRSDLWFRVLASSYSRSGVMEDVYHQSEDDRDRNGGYFITVLRAV